ncbi:MAG: hypothetical protein N2482_02515 [Patescibacteria group bacterium]|nr:hypothetical protein [Patescibacteria group bacterium]
MEKLGIDLKLLIAQIFNFFLFLFIFKKFIASSFLKFLAEEKKKQIEKERFEQEKKIFEEKWQEEKTRMKEELEKEKKTLLKDIHNEADKQKKEILDKARKETDQLRERTKAELEKERIMMEKEMMKKVVDLSINIVNTSLRDYLTESMKKDITQMILKNLKKEN